MLRCLSFFMFVLLLPVHAAFAQSELSSEAKARAYAASFEVVIPKPDHDPLKYEKELPWAQIPFNLRNDKYYSIGTAFAISPTELLTAFHVLDLHLVSRTFTRIFIRDRENQVFELDRILLADQARDVVKFSVKRPPFTQWLGLSTTYTLNQTVFTMGNAYGEGLVLRKGDLIGTIPESEGGRWNLLRSSADVNSGNSGGALIDGQGKVIGVVLARKDNISLSLPVAEFQALNPGVAHFHRKTGYSFALVPERVDLVDNDFEVSLPKGYAEVREEAHKEGMKIYDQRMGELFAQAQDQYFPKGEASHEAILDIPNSTGLEFWFKDKDTKKWALSDLEYKAHEAGGEARVFFAASNNLGFGVVKPNTPEELPTLFSNPRALMDLFLKGINYPREMAGQQIRITSLGDPIESQELRDSMRRTWRLHIWLLPHLDQYVAIYTAPVPRGVGFVLKQMPTFAIHEWRYDMRRILDLVYLPYSGNTLQWNVFLGMREWIPGDLKQVKVHLEADRRLLVQTPWVTFQVGKEDLELDPLMTVNLGMGFAWQGSDVVWDLRRANVAEAEEDGFVTLLRHLKPTPSMSDAFQRSWREVQKRRHPYTGAPFSEDGATRIATVLNLGQGAAGEAPSSLYTLYLSKAGTQSDRAMKNVFKHLGEGYKAPVQSLPAGTP
ncbi:MAG: trypsin-like peptidase domain-containing protein [Acidobacteria bacterium]|nr:trypsin-like peptidase domain-containing protein [Acidobacteriota bacterium]